MTITPGAEPGSAPMRREVLAVSRPGTRPPIADELIALLTRALRGVGA